MLLDKENGNTFWADAVRRELDQLFSYKTFHDLGPRGLPGTEYKKIKIRFVFDVKADGRRKGRLVARGDMTPEPDEAVYSSVATLHSLRIVIFLAELNGLNLMQGDVGNAYLESYTQEKVYFIAGPEFGHHAGTRKHYMDYVRVGCDFMSIYPKSSKVSTLSALMLTRMCGCMMPATHGHILLSM